MEKYKLKPCPFCGGKAQANTYFGSEEYFVRCTVCKARTRDLEGFEHAVEFWNRRYNDK